MGGFCGIQLGNSERQIAEQETLKSSRLSEVGDRLCTVDLSTATARRGSCMSEPQYGTTKEGLRGQHCRQKKPFLIQQAHNQAELLRSGPIDASLLPPSWTSTIRQYSWRRSLHTWGKCRGICVTAEGLDDKESNVHGTACGICDTSQP